MATSGKAASLPDQLRRTLAAWPLHGRRVTVGLSGGLDSVVLLNLLHEIEADAGFTLAAFHVQHNLSPHAAAWTCFCKDLCAHLNVPFQSESVQVAARGEGLEAAARAARYAAFARLATDFLVLGQHADDQAETLLLQLLRGGGVAGLAAMPPARPYAGLTLLRPLLGTSRDILAAYAADRRLHWVEDESNADTAFSRNFLRHEVLPVLRRRYPAASATLARVAGHVAEALQLLDEVADRDLANLAGQGVSLAGLRALSAPRQKNLLRRWLSRETEWLPGADYLEEMRHQILDAREESPLGLPVGGSVLYRYRDRLHLARPAAGFTPVRWRGEPTLTLSNGRQLDIVRTRGEGIAAQLVVPGQLTLHPRAGGERIRPAAGRPRRALKQLLQEAGCPPWERAGLVCISAPGRLLAVAGIAVEAAAQAGPEEEGILIRVRPI